MAGERVKDFVNLHYDTLQKELGPPGKSYEVVCDSCKKIKWPYLVGPLPVPYVCALCVIRALRADGKPGVKKPRKRPRKVREIKVGVRPRGRKKNAP